MSSRRRPYQRTRGFPGGRPEGDTARPDPADPAVPDVTRGGCGEPATASAY